MTEKAILLEFSEIKARLAAVEVVCQRTMARQPDGAVELHDWPLACEKAEAERDEARRWAIRLARRDWQEELTAKEVETMPDWLAQGIGMEGENVR